jgi:hypothetical protein
MDGASVKGRTKVYYKSPRHVQVLFLQRSRGGWKNKYQLSKQNERRLENAVRDVTKSRDKWATKAREQTARLKSVDAENASLKQELELLKKESDFLV